MADLLRIVLLVPAATLSTAALLTIVAYLSPERSNRAKQSFERMPGRSFVIGLVNFLFFGLLAAVLGQGGEFLRMISLLILLSLIALTMVGLSGLLLTLRARVYPVDTVGVATLGATMRSALLLVIACLAPIAGWFILAPIIAIESLGCGIIAFVNRQAPV